MTILHDPARGDQHPRLPHPDDLEGLALGEKALHYAREGLPILPLAPGGKTPLTAHGYKCASTDVATVLRWWRHDPAANIGLVTGPGSFDVLDVDVRPDGSGLPAVAHWRDSGLLPRPAHVVLTPSGGQHLYYRGTSQRSSGLRDAHIDLKAAGGYVVAPGSLIPAGESVVEYQEVRAERREEAPNPLPWPDLVAEVNGDRQRATPARPATGPVPSSTAYLVDFVKGLQEGNRNNGLFWALCRALEQGLPVEPLCEAALGIGLSWDEVRQTLNSARNRVSQ